MLSVNCYQGFASVNYKSKARNQTAPCLNKSLFKASVKQDSFISFTGSPLSEVTAAFKKAYPGKKLSFVLLNAMKKENILGIGKDTVCFKIPKVNEYVLKQRIKVKDAPKADEKITILEVENLYKERNFGQVIAKFGDSMELAKRVPGKSYSLNPWVDYSRRNKEITQKDIIFFINNLKKVSRFKQKSYNDFAESLSFLNSKNIKIDSINPNNLIVDDKTQAFGLIDFFEDCPYKNTHHDMIQMLTDMELFKKIYAMIPQSKQKKLVQYAKAIVEKSEIAGKTVNLYDSKEHYFDYLTYIENRNPNHFKRVEGEAFAPCYKYLRQLLNNASD